MKADSRKRNPVMVIGFLGAGVILLTVFLVVLRGFRPPRSPSENRTAKQVIPQRDNLEVTKLAETKLNPVFTVVPGHTIQSLRERFGKEQESTTGTYKSHTWKLADCSLEVEVNESGQVKDVYILFTGVPLLTPQGITLGRDTLTEFKAKLASRIMTEQEELFAGEGQWILSEVIRRDNGINWKTTYIWSLSEMIPEENALLQQQWPHTPEVFLAVRVTGYRLSVPQL